MKKWAYFCTGLFLLLTLAFGVLYRVTEISLFLTLAIVFGTTDYHFVMRLAVGVVANTIFHNQMDYTRWWFRPKKWEQPLLKAVGVAKWRGRMPTYDPTAFDIRTKTLAQIAGAMCQAEVTHEAVMVLSWLPLLLIPAYGAWPAFVITSFLSCLADSLFVMMQRYNRPRLVRLIEHSKGREDKLKRFISKE